MKKELLLAAVALFCSILSFAQPAQSFNKQWQEIDSLIVIKNLPKSALGKVNLLYADAKKKNSYDEMIKALLYQLSLKERTSETDINQQVALLKNEMATTRDTISKAVLTVLLAKEINNYYNQNIWRNSQRKETNDYKENDIATWSNGQLIQTTDSLYGEAISHAVLLQKTEITYLNAVLIRGNTPHTRPTLYDLIAHGALDYYKTGLAYITQPTYAFRLNDAHALADASSFVQYTFSSADTSSHLLKAIKLFQQLLLFHANDADPAAFIDINIERIEWAYSTAGIDDKEKLYQQALHDITRHFTNTKPAAEAWYLLAKWEADKAGSYKPLTDTTNRYGYVKAKAIIEERLKAMPGSCYGNEEMKALLKGMMTPELHTKAESVNVANAPFRVFVQYSNIDTLYARVLMQKDLDRVRKNKDWSEWRDSRLLPYVKAFQQALPRTGDYQTHSVEIKADALPPGNYTILFGSSNHFDDDKDKLAAQAFTVSRLAYFRNDKDYFVVDRETGQPIRNVKVTGKIEVRRRNSSRSILQGIGTIYTDSHGHFTLPVDVKSYGSSNVELTLQKDRDTLQVSDNFYSYEYSNNNDNDDEDDSSYENKHSHVYLFTDRSIYRPGQTVWYKGIVTTEDKKTKQRKLYHYTDSVEIDLCDANNKTIDSQFVQLNEYGSFSGKLLLPQSVLTGEFSIETFDFTEGEAKFNVEEYKRPTFYAVFDTLKSSYRLNDTIVLTGFAKAYAGNAVDGAKVKYNIERTASFPYSYLFWNRRNPYSETIQIADSTIDIDANGSFTIRFAAVPDSSVDRDTKPLFNYNIEVSITDANGETRETRTNIQVGYQAVVLHVNTPETAEVSNFTNIFITTKNNAGENIPANVNITVSPLQTPAKAYRKWLWEQPDQFVMSREEFVSYFPYDEYETETDYHQWKKEKAIIQDTFSTANTSAYKLPATGLKQGWYCIEATTTDKDGSEIKDVSYVQLYDMNATGLPSPQTEFSQVISNGGAPGDKAELLLGSSEPDVSVVIDLKRNNRAASDSFSYVKLDNDKKRIDYTIRPTDKESPGLYYAFVKHNSFYTGGTQIYITNTQQQLNITYASYRNKTESGSKETWTVQVTDSNHKTAAAELLTSMYDASLDQFKKQRWDMPDFASHDYVSNAWEANNFGSGNSGENYHWYGSYNPGKAYDHIATSADELWEVYRIERNRRMNMSKSFYNEGEMFLNSERIGVINQAGSKSDVVVVGYGTARKNGLVGAAPGLSIGNLSEVVVTRASGVDRQSKALGYSITETNYQSLSDTSFFNMKVRGITSTSNLNAILVIIDGVITETKISELDASTIDHVDVLKGSEAIALYGAKAANGAIIVTTKDYALRNGKKKETPPVQIRTNFSETVFFFPQLHADSTGNYSFSFTMPDAVTTWKWMSLAHDKQLAFGYREQSVITQKTLMVQPNLPRFLREGDAIELTAKISNLSDSVIKGNASLQLLDAVTLQPLNDSFHITQAPQSFSAEPNRSTIVTFPLRIPLNYTHPVTIKIIATSNRYSDGEEHTLPVLSNRTFVTETLPLYLPDGGTKGFAFDKLVNQHSASLTNESVTVEYTTNPVWAVVQSLPYLMQFPHECAEQIFNRFYANTLASYIVETHPQIKQVLAKWKQDSASLQSNLSTNPELKSILLNETPWVNDAESETQQRRNVALLFDAVKMYDGAASALQQLKEMQMDDGAFAWFKGGSADRYITQYILTGIGKLNRLHTLIGKEQSVLDEITSKALRYLDAEEEKDYARLIKNKADLTKDLLWQQDIQYWYMRSFYGEQQNSIPADAFLFYIKQTAQYWTKQSPYMQGMIAMALHRFSLRTKPDLKLKTTALDIVRSLKENAVTDSSKGMYWKESEPGYYWYQSPVETQALLINMFEEITGDDSSVNAMQQWLLLHKQTHHWETTKATADACFVMLNNTSLDSSQSDAVTIRLGDSTVSSTSETSEAGSGYIKHRIDGKSVMPSMGNVSVSVLQPASKHISSSLSYGAVYWQYFEDMDKITAVASPLSVTKKIFIEINTDKGKQLQPVNDNNTLKTGDKIIIRLIIKSDRDMEYVHLSDTRAAAMEPVNVVSGYKWQDGLGYYESTKDASTNFFIDHLAKGTYVFDYPVYLTHDGNFSTGIATLQCMYAPSFAAHSGGERIWVDRSK